MPLWLKLSNNLSRPTNELVHRHWLFTIYELSKWTHPDDACDSRIQSRALYQLIWKLNIQFIHMRLWYSSKKKNTFFSCCCCCCCCPLRASFSHTSKLIKFYWHQSISLLLWLWHSFWMHVYILHLPLLWFNASVTGYCLLRPMQHYTLYVSYVYCMWYVTEYLSSPFKSLSQFWLQPFDPIGIIQGRFSFKIFDFIFFFFFSDFWCYQNVFDREYVCVTANRWEGTYFVCVHFHMFFLFLFVFKI